MASEKPQKALFPEPSSGSTVLTDTEISEAVASGLLIARETFDQTGLESCSYDVRVGLKGILGGRGVEIDLRASALELGPGAYAGVLSLEKLVLRRDTFARIWREALLLLRGSNLPDRGDRGSRVRRASARQKAARTG